ncbi:hypothetical protein GCM10009835_42930 [Planosporangium flavigriseum]|uniref:Tetratricopeptide repeat protein n=1 Tax=Planosporangium flavigriseum TaxID=373681 RepID=A0A8J3PP52_9ACTN|nr:trypsin-like peptidase domain-containing protein [Planosporangium flavigriseum]GIG74681.1 hypothetical protein Pfl04_30850 [Planosporangium flavigriseum]
MRINSVAEVYGGASGTGHVLGQDLVLTASHVVADGHAASVRTLGSAEWVDADVIWRGTGDVDAALLRTRRPLPSETVDSSLRWGSVGTYEQISCRVTGFPAVQARSSGVRDTDTFCGQTVPGAGYKNGRIVIQSAGGPRDRIGSVSPWAGISGGAVFSSPESHLLGIVESVPAGYPNNRLKVVPTSTLLKDSRFREFVGDPAIRSVTKSGSVIHPPYGTLPDRHPASWLLDPRYAVVDFIDDGGWLDDLTKWATSSERFSIGAISGSGGMGKSRLAAELADRMRQVGWDAGYLNIDNVQSWHEVSSEHPLLIIIDYASRFGERLAGLIERLAANSSGKPVRLLLVERRLGAWWETVNRVTRRRAQHLLDKHVVLRESSISPESVSRHLELAMSSLSRKLGVEPIPASEIRTGDSTSPLLIHISVLLALRGTGLEPGGAEPLGRSPATREALLQGLLDREVTRWEAALEAHKLGHLHSAQAGRLVAMASLFSPTRAEAKVLLERMPEICSQPDVLKAVEWLADMFGSEDGVIRPVGPDLVVEHLLETLNDLDSLVLRLLDVRDALTDAPRARMFHLLSLSAQSGRNSRAALTAALARHLPQLLEAEISNAETEDHSLLVGALSASDKSNIALSRIAQQVAASIPSDSERLAEVRAEVFGLAITRGRRRAGGGIDKVPDELLVDERAADFAELGRLLNELGTSLGHLSRWGRAQAATLEAVEIFSVLSAKFGNFHDRRSLAVALSHAGQFFRSLRLHDQSLRSAMRATELWRELAVEDPKEREDLAIALTNLADSLCSAGKPAEAIAYSTEAIALLRSELRQGGERARPRLERALSELAHHLMEVGDVDWAREAITEAASSVGFEVGQTVETNRLDSVGYLNGLAAELLLREGEFEKAKSCAIISASAYGKYAHEYQGNFYYLRGSLQLLLRVLDAAGEAEDAAAMRADLAHLLVEPGIEDYDKEVKEFEAFAHIIEGRGASTMFSTAVRR